MTLHYHGTPISPIATLEELAGRCFCVSYVARQDVARCHEIGQSVMLDNGAFHYWKRRKQVDWHTYYLWCDQWLNWPATWAIPPDVIDGGEVLQDDLLAQWPHGKRQAAPVWHMNECLSRLLRLIEQGWNRVCIGSTSEFGAILSDAWKRRMDEVWKLLYLIFGRPPPIHMLRGMQLSGHPWPFLSVDSTDIGRNHNRVHNDARRMADRWDAIQCPGQGRKTGRRTPYSLLELL